MHKKTTNSSNNYATKALSVNIYIGNDKVAREKTSGDVQKRRLRNCERNEEGM